MSKVQIVDLANTCKPKVAVIVPIFRHSVLLVDAIESVLRQIADFQIHVILVNDGCPFLETDEVCRDYALGYSRQVTYLKKINGGLSASRNFGVSFALHRWPSIEAIYFLDADNILRERSLANAMTYLEKNRAISWVYPNIDMFGMANHFDYGGKYSLLLHSQENLCEAGSLVHRRVFDSGVYFDEEFKLGYEDWDFFLSAAEKGFIGDNLENFGFLYRKRPASMLAGSTQLDITIRSSIVLKHKKLYQPKFLLNLEHIDFPRYGIYLFDKNIIMICVDPNAEPEYWTVEEFTVIFWRSQIAPSRFYCPQYITAMSSLTLESLQRSKLLHWTLWHLQIKLAHSHISTLTISNNTVGRVKYIDDHHDAKELRLKSIAMIQPKILREVIHDPSSNWFDSFLTPYSSVTVSSFDLSFQGAAEEFDGHDTSDFPTFDISADSALHDLVHALRSSHFKSAFVEKWEWREAGVSLRQNPGMVVTRQFSNCPGFPKITTSSRNIGFVLPIIEFGGVEKVALNIATALKAQGWVPHLIVAGSKDIALSKEWTLAFETISFLSDDNFAIWGESESSYYGTDVPSWGIKGKHDKALSLLCWLDIVINFHSASLSGIMGQLKRFGIRTATSLHLSDLSAASRPVGNVYLGLAYEHSYDYFIPCSEELADWCHGMGIPREKIIPVLNAPSFYVEAKKLSLTQRQRAKRNPKDPLRVLYIGRLDYQKGIDQLGNVINMAANEGLCIEWRVIGKTVLDSKDQNKYFEIIRPFLESPKTEASELAAIYEWADVLVLLSRYEGLPLTILEALRSGVVPLATDVGAVHEVVINENNGILLDPRDVAVSCLEVLRSLCSSRNILLRMSNRAFLGAQGRDWIHATKNINLVFSRDLDRRKSNTTH